MKRNLQKSKKKAQKLAYEDVNKMDIQSTSEGKSTLRARYEYHIKV